MLDYEFLSVSIPNLCVIAILLCSLSFLKLLFRNLVLPTFFSKQNSIKKFGKWAVITGSTDGIGKGFAEVLANKNYNLVLISRNMEKLENVKAEISSKSSIDIKLISADFTKLDIYDKIENELKSLDIGLLINNVAMSSEFPDFLTNETNSGQILTNMIICNCLSAVRMTKLVLQLGMREKGGFVLNVSSAAGAFPTGLLSTYGATKAFINSFTVNMESELSRSSNVTFQTVAPFLVSTKMSKVRPSLFIPSSQAYARSTIKRLGTCAFTHGCFMHELQGWFIGWLPNVLLEKLVFSAHINIRQKALRKATKRE